MHKTTEGFIVELIPVILYIEMSTWDVNKAQSPMHTKKFFLWQTLFAGVDENILSNLCYNVFAN